MKFPQLFPDWSASAALMRSPSVCAAAGGSLEVQHLDTEARMWELINIVVLPAHGGTAIEWRKYQTIV
jgi:hypothetical protein